MLTKGMIESNLGLGRLKEAANWSRESIRLYPKSAESYYMMGNVLAKSSNAANEVTQLTSLPTWHTC